MKRQPLRNCITLFAVIALALAVGGASAATSGSERDPLVKFNFSAEEGRDLPFLLVADETRYIDEPQTIIASGSVRISRENRILTADRVEYRVADKILAAKGDVTLVEPTGEVLFADEVELTDDLSQGFAVAPRVLLADGSRVAAAGTSRISKDRIEVQRAVFSPCALCAKDPKRAPLWQLRAGRIVHSETRQEIELYDATLDLFGVPVAYVPYYSQPDPRVTKKTGFLTPKFGQDDSLGITAEIPFFWNIAPNRDLTITPRIFSEKLPILSSTYRHLFAFGQTEVETSAGFVERTENGVTSNNHLRGHLRWQGEASLTERWRTQFQYYRSGDDTYLRTFNIDDAGVLRSFATLEGFYRRLYINATAFTVQEQRTNFDEDDTPTAFPFVTADYAAPLGIGGINATAQTAAHVLFRPDGGDTQHATARFGLNRHWNAGGNLFSAEASLRGDAFHSTEAPSGDESVQFRLQPRATVNWSLPLFRPLGDGTLTLTPRVMATASTSGLNTSDLPNEDSQSLEFDATALFRPTLSDGRDRFDDGQRVDYGLEGEYDFGRGRVSALVGQSYQVNSSRSFGRGTGLDEPLSNIVLGFGIEAGSWMDGYQRIRWDIKQGNLTAAESGLRLTKGRVEANLRHSYLQERRFDSEVLEENHQISGDLRLQLSDNWAVVSRHSHDLGRGEALKTQLGISYGDECISLELIGTRDRTRTAEVGPNDSIILRVALRHLGAASGKQTLSEE